MQGASKIDEDAVNSQEPTSATNKFSARSILNNTIKFRLANRSESDIPINSKPIKIDGNFNNKINKYIAPKST